MPGPVVCSHVGDGTDQVPSTTLIAGVAKAWSSFSYSGGTPTSRDGFNVSSFADTGTGQATVNWSTAFPDANYSALASGQSNALGGARAPIAQRLAGSQRVDGYNDSGSAADTTSDVAAIDNP